MESTGDMQLDEIVLNDGIKKLGNYAFWNFRNLKILLFQNLLQISENQPFMGVQHYPILLYQIL